MYPDLNKVTKKFLEEVKGYRKKLLELGYTEVIVQYFERKEFYMHPNPRKHSSVTGLNFSDPIVWNIEDNTMSLEHLHNNEKVYLPELKFGFNEDKIEGLILTKISIINESLFMNQVIKKSFPEYGEIILEKDLVNVC